MRPITDAAYPKLPCWEQPILLPPVRGLRCLCSTFAGIAPLPFSVGGPGTAPLPFPVKRLRCLCSTFPGNAPLPFPAVVRRCTFPGAAQLSGAFRDAAPLRSFRVAFPGAPLPLAVGKLRRLVSNYTSPVSGAIACVSFAWLTPPAGVATVAMAAHSVQMIAEATRTSAARAHREE